MGQRVYVRSPSANFVNTWRYEPGRLVGELNGNVYRVETREVVSVFEHISQIRLRTADQVKPFEIPQSQDQDNPTDTQEISCECCDLSTIYDLSGVVLFRNHLIIKDSTNRDHWVNLTAGTDWAKIDLCFASASRRSNFYRDIRIVDVELPTNTASQLVHRLRQLAQVDTILLPATTDFIHKSNAAYFLNMVNSFTEAAKVTDVPCLDCIPRPLLTSFTIANYSILRRTQQPSRSTSVYGRKLRC